MKIATVARYVLSGFAIYLAMAACSAAEHASAQRETDGSASGAPSLTDAIAEAVVDPVPEASAGPAADVATEKCDKTYDDGTTYTYAEHAYPGATKAELANVVVLGTRPHGPPGYTEQQWPTWVRDGAVSVVCGNSGINTITAATFIRP